MKSQTIDHHKLGRSSKRKGAAGERELAKTLNKLLGLNSIRGRQFCGAAGNPDVIIQKVENETAFQIPGLHVECKRVEKLNLYAALKQSENDARSGEIPVVCHRRNNDSWIISFRLDNLQPLGEWLESLKQHDNSRDRNPTQGGENGEEGVVAQADARPIQPDQKSL